MVWTLDELQTHRRLGANCSIREGVGEQCGQNRLVCVISVLIGHSDLQGNILLVAE